MLETLFTYSGLLATIWIVFGILFVGSRYEGYSHSAQFCSELGAAGSPTQNLSPRVNNYPLSILFCVFGIQVISQTPQSILFVFIGGLIFIHGVGTLIAGYFPMDKDPYTKQPSTACKIHSLAGFAMLLSLLIAPALTLFSTRFSVNFKIFSIACLLATLFFVGTFARAYKNKSQVGTHQRLSYGAQLIWLAGLSLWLA